ncbi:hypothetical protein C8F01DRAFT_1158913 [Mycena amicta]|nr:hypothetical protein C8F01DRAFT_1158913 [Mycena amicta]
MKHSNSDLRRATLLCIKDLGVQGMFAFQAALRTAIPSVVEAMKDPDRYVRRAARICLGALGAQVEFQTELRPAIPILMEALRDSRTHFDAATIACLELEFQTEIRAAIPMLVEGLRVSHLDLRRAILECVSAFGARDSEIVILTLLEWATADDADQRTTAVYSLLSLLKSP